MRTVAFAAAIAALCALACGSDENPYVEGNERILEELPVFPGAVQESVTSSPYYDEEGPAPSRVAGYTTNVVYDVPADVTDRQVIEFYVLSLQSDWSYQATELPITDTTTGERVGAVLIVDFRREEATVQVNTDGMSAGEGHTFEVVVDQRGDPD